MEHNDDARWLGEDMVQQAHTRITVPPDVIEQGMVEPGKLVYWAVDDDGVLLSKNREQLEKHDRVRVIGESTVSDDHEVTFPREIAQQDGFGPGAILHFLTVEEVAAENMCRVVPEELTDRQSV